MKREVFEKLILDAFNKYAKNIEKIQFHYYKDIVNPTDCEYSIELIVEGTLYGDRSLKSIYQSVCVHGTYINDYVLQAYVEDVILAMARHRFLQG